MRSPPASVVHGSDSSDATYVLGCARISQTAVWDAYKYGERWRHHGLYQLPITKKKREAEAKAAAMTGSELSYPSSSRVARQMRRAVSVARRNSVGTWVLDHLGLRDKSGDSVSPALEAESEDLLHIFPGAK